MVSKTTELKSERSFVSLHKSSELQNYVLVWTSKYLPYVLVIVRLSLEVTETVPC